MYLVLVQMDSGFTAQLSTTKLDSCVAEDTQIKYKFYVRQVVYQGEKRAQQTVQETVDTNGSSSLHQQCLQLETHKEQAKVSLFPQILCNQIRVVMVDRQVVLFTVHQKAVIHTPLSSTLGFLRSQYISGRKDVPGVPDVKRYARKDLFLVWKMSFYN